jgi:hypothetical protein
MSVLELIATLLGVTHLFLLIRQSLWAFPVGIGMVSLYALIFYNAQLYGNAGLQGVFCALLAYGWWYWLSHRSKAEAADKAPIKTLSLRAIGLWLGAGVAGVAVIGTIMDRFTDGGPALFGRDHRQLLAGRAGLAGAQISAELADLDWRRCRCDRGVFQSGALSDQRAVRAVPAYVHLGLLGVAPR